MSSLIIQRSHDMRSHAPRPCVAPRNLNQHNAIGDPVTRGAYRGGSRFLLYVCPSHTNRVFGGRPTCTSRMVSPITCTPHRSTYPRGATVALWAAFYC